MKGGAQQLKRYWRLLFFNREPDMSMNFAQRWYHLQAWAAWTRDAILLVCFLFYLVVIVLICLDCMHVNHMITLNYCVVLVHASLLARQFYIYKVYLRRSSVDALNATVASAGLGWTIGWAWLAGFVSRDVVFHRTPKCRSACDNKYPIMGELSVIISVGLFSIMLFGVVGWTAFGTFFAFAAFGLTASCALWTALCDAMDIAAAASGVANGAFGSLKRKTRTAGVPVNLNRQSCVGEPGPCSAPASAPPPTQAARRPHS